MEPLSLTKMIDEKKIASRVTEMAQEITKALKGEPVIAVCVLKGSFVFYSDLIRNMETDVRTDFLGCSSYGNSMKSSGEVRLTLDLTHGIEGKTVLLVEDIIDTGLTMSFLTKTLEARNPKKILTASLLFKPKALKTDLKPDFIGFEISNEFVVGYGLDYQGYYRNLPYVAQVKQKQLDS
ncbi:MAG TPA: hypoxanthine phosphoribosyltransferase [Bdellovibrionales bacterium]|nr:hypoxanthine phosphoribosyltransferase [Bdellovibrionales bacterium]